MKTNFADPDYARKVAMMQQQSLNVFPPAILYTKVKPKLDSKTDIVKDQYQKIKVPIDHQDPNGQRTEWKVPLFENGTPEEFMFDSHLRGFRPIREAFPDREMDQTTFYICLAISSLF